MSVKPAIVKSPCKIPKRNIGTLQKTVATHKLISDRTFTLLLSFQLSFLLMIQTRYSFELFHMQKQILMLRTLLACGPLQPAGKVIFHMLNDKEGFYQ